MFLCFISLTLRFFSFLLKRQQSQYAGQGGQHQAQAPGRSGRGVSAATQFKQTPTEVQVARFLFQFLPEVRRPLLAVGQRRRGTGVEVVPVTGERRQRGLAPQANDWSGRRPGSRTQSHGWWPVQTGNEEPSGLHGADGVQQNSRVSLQL